MARSGACASPTAGLCMLSDKRSGGVRVGHNCAARVPLLGVGRSPIVRRAQAVPPRACLPLVLCCGSVLPGLDLGRAWGRAGQTLPLGISRAHRFRMGDPGAGVEKNSRLEKTLGWHPILTASNDESKFSPTNLRHLAHEWRPACVRASMHNSALCSTHTTSGGHPHNP